MLKHLRTTATAAALVVSGTLLIGAGTAAAHPGKPGHGKPDPGTPLRVAADRAHVKFGTAVNTTALADDATYRRITAQQFSSVTAENVMKWETLQPQRGVYDFTEADRLVAFARAHGQSVRGHTLLWHNQLPAWLTEGLADGSIDAAELRGILRDHITTVVRHFKGKLYQWDVVNEVFEEDGSYRNSIWLEKLGPGYIADAFRWAREADPNVKLFFNDYNVEGVNAKSTAYYGLAKQLKARGVRVDGFGIQGHLSTQYGFPGDVGANLKRFADLGLQTAFTEVDVRVPLPADPAKLATQADYYRGLLSACLGSRSCTSFTVWGFADQYSWVPGVFDGEGAACLYDESYRTKPAFDALRAELRQGRH
ncbi:endo-1,4-beta-xylanase [Streptomyces sp. XM83C]|uniref:endo-1,4-beta-xylanase n=1 Tax=Streptomyces sp. XM83C TaxID=2929781 RepID=UPI001FF8FDCB|nr:endo-1,4-beta-xylanase [Streptomyces sp. XM83C]MCK1818286.1 endo-1,4-beta-xylanase [Streptomyces sp. XM83C]